MLSLGSGSVCYNKACSEEQGLGRGRARHLIEDGSTKVCCLPGPMHGVNTVNDITRLLVELQNLKDRWQNGNYTDWRGDEAFDACASALEELLEKYK